MCYQLFLSTTSPDDLSLLNTANVRLEKILDPTTDPDADCLAVLDFPNKWYIGSLSGCSCTFRYLHSLQLFEEVGFFESLDWWPEDEESRQSTIELYRIIRSLLFAGQAVDLGIFDGPGLSDDLPTIDVSFSTVSERAFLLCNESKYRLSLA